MDDLETLAREVGASAEALGVRTAVAESLTGGLVCSSLSAAPDASTWFAGGVVAYASDVKHALLGVPAGPVVSAESARAMASAASRLLDAEYAVALTGVGGPDPQDGHPPGTVFLAVASPSAVRHVQLSLTGDPGEIGRQAAAHALSALQRALSTGSGARGRRSAVSAQS